jgi:endonuclease/exonuclease/phosphatase family metal-dependent hydrolase
VTRLLLAAALLTVGCAAAQPPSLTTRTSGREVVFAAVSWNVHEGRGDLPRLIDDLTSGRLTGAPVREYVILLQETIEGRWHDAMAIANARRLFATFDPVRTTSRGTSGNAILATQPLSNVQAIALPRERRVRRAIAATLEIGGQPLLAVCLHLENRTSWRRGAGFLGSDEARARQVDALLQTIPDVPGVAGGDLNTWRGPDEPAVRALLERFDDTPANERAEPTFWYGLVLDFLFFDLPNGWQAASAVVPDRYGSDHRPVVGVIVERPGL